MNENQTTTCNVAYDKSYIDEGYILYQNDYKTFIKIIHTYGQNFIIFANDEYEDEPDKMNFRPITLEVDELSPLFESIRELTNRLTVKIFSSVNRVGNGDSHLMMTEKDENYEISVLKDIRFKKLVEYNCVLFEIKDTCNHDLMNFYRQLEAICQNKESDIVMTKMLNLIPCKRR